ncbi:MAG TPA: TIGR04348 family glycosyltransferase, partial [Candidatus Binatia bacterium]|nr:TIGR04348 family glycosyltransferase [Candidatus Binatia bacterium]
VPVIASKIAGLIGTLGPHYPGYFPLGDTKRLRKQLLKAEADMAFYRRLNRDCGQLAKLVEPTREVKAWRRLLAECNPKRSRK